MTDRVSAFFEIVGPCFPRLFGIIIGVTKSNNFKYFFKSLTKGTFFYFCSNGFVQQPYSLFNISINNCRRNLTIKKLNSKGKCTVDQVSPSANQL